MALPYSEGAAFLVPLRNGGYARGVVTRASPKGKVLFGYFFGPIIANAKDASLDDIGPDTSVLRVMFGDLGLAKGVWRIYAQLPQWDRTKWPMPDFIRRDDISRKAWLVRYSDDDPTEIESESPIDFDAELQRDSLSGYGAVEIKLSKLLGSERRSVSDGADTETLNGCASMKNTKYPIHHYLYFPEQQVGERVANILRTQGYVVEDRLGADEVNWLVLAKSDATPTSATIEKQGQYLQQIAEENNGEYDGWEAEGMHV